MREGAIHPLIAKQIDTLELFGPTVMIFTDLDDFEDFKDEQMEIEELDFELT